MKRNLIYYICPFKSNYEWKKNIEELLQYLEVFNNRLIVSIARGKDLEDPSKVKKMFGVKKCEYLEVENNRNLGETEPFMKMLKRVYSVDPEEISFYAHAKGVSPSHQLSRLKNIQIWRNLMYYFCLGNIQQIDTVIKNFSSCGCFKRDFPCSPNVPEPWHFSGTFFWFNHANLFNCSNWSEIRKDTRFAAERYLATLFDSSSAYCLFGEAQKGNVASPDIFSKREWAKLLKPYRLNSNHFCDPRFRTINWAGEKARELWRKVKYEFRLNQ